jgi:hypothetical protein
MRKAISEMTVGDLVSMLESCDQSAKIRFTGWQGLNNLTVCEAWKAKENGIVSPVITFEEIN